MCESRSMDMFSRECLLRLRSVCSRWWNERSLGLSVRLGRENPPIKSPIRVQTDAILDSFFLHESQRGRLVLPWPEPARFRMCALCHQARNFRSIFEPTTGTAIYFLRNARKCLRKYLMWNPDLFYHIALVYNCKISAHTRTLKWFIYHETRFDYFSWNITQFVLSVERVWLYKYTIHRNLTQSISLGNIFAFFNIAPTARREYVSWFSIKLRLRKNHSTSWHNYYHEKCVQTND